MMWALLAFFAMLTLAVQVEANRHYNIEGHALNFWRSLIAAALLLFISCFVRWPVDPQIYLLAFVDGMGAIFTYYVLFTLAARKLSRVSSMYSPLATLTGLLLWLLYSNAEQTRMADSPTAGLCLVVALGLAAYGLSYLRQSDVSWRAFFMVVPVGLFYGAMDVLTRVILVSEDLLGTVVVYSALTFATTALFIGAHLQKSGLLFVSARTATVQAGLVLGVASAGFFLLLTPAVILAPNPAYPGFFIMTMPVCLALYHKIKKISDPTNWRAAFLVVLGAAIAALQAVWFV